MTTMVVELTCTLDLQAHEVETMLALSPVSDEDPETQVAKFVLAQPALVIRQFARPGDVEVTIA